MYVCHCRAVTDWAVRTAIASGARSVADLAATCPGVGRNCGGCVGRLQRYLDIMVGLRESQPIPRQPRSENASRDLHSLRRSNDFRIWDPEGCDARGNTT
jgi:bacterioferritin-associated ferredoxin